MTLKAKTNYKKISTFEARVGEAKKILLLFSGGLDTSVALKWLEDRYRAKIIALTLNLGQQHDDLDFIKNKALQLGAIKAITLDVREEFASEYLSKAIKANAAYQGDYHLSTPIGRAILAKKAVEIAHREKVDAIAHGCTGKGNDQVRIEGGILALDPKLKIIAPIREWDMDRDEEIEYAQKNHIPVPASINFPYSDDDNMWGMTWEGGEIEFPHLIPPVEKFLTTYTLPKNAQNKEELVKLTFDNGLPVAINGKGMSLARLIVNLNKIAGKHGVGIAHILEDRLVGVKSRGVYDQPAAHVIIEAHKALEKYVSTRTLNELKATLDIKWAYLCYGALWYDPTMSAINAFNDKINELVNGEVTLQLHKGKVTVVAIKSAEGLDFVSFTHKEGYDFNINASAGFTEIYGLQMKIANQRKRRAKKRNKK